MYDTTEKTDKAEDLNVELVNLRNVVNIKAYIFKEIMNKVDAFGACDLTCHECILQDEVEHYKEDIVVEKEEIFKKTGIENKEILSKKHENKQTVFHSMKGNNEKAIEVNNELKLNVDEQQDDDLIHLKEQCDIYDIDKVQEITAARTPMEKNKRVCVTCNKKISIKNGLKNISRKITLISGENIVAKCSEI